MTPILKKISSSRVASDEIANLLEKHLGPDPSETHCIQAIEAVGRIRDLQVRGSLKVVMLVCGGSPCNQVKQLPEFLRSLDHGCAAAQPILPADAFGAAEVKR